MADPYYSRGRPYVSNTGQLRFKTPAFGLLEKLSERYLGPGVEFKRQVEAENLDRLLNPVKPDISPDLPRDIVSYHEKVIREKIAKEMELRKMQMWTEQDVLPEELDEIGVPYIPPRVPRRSASLRDLSISAPDDLPR
tara:strand:- start:131 stop:544 length:414 start_codon:yes stop_codon:yes gene_type:complete